MKTFVKIALLAATLVASAQYQQDSPGGPPGRQPYRVRTAPRRGDDVRPGQVYPPPDVEDVVPGRGSSYENAVSTTTTGSPPRTAPPAP